MGGVTTCRIEPFARRARFALNYLPLLLCVLFACLAVCMAVGVVQPVVLVSVSVAGLIGAIDWIGRRPLLRVDGREIYVRNLVRTTRIDAEQITAISTHSLRLGQGDWCAQILLASDRRPRKIAVLALFLHDGQELLTI